MSFGISDIVIYGPQQTSRTLSLKPFGANIIVGESESGKTALLDVLNYCLGAEKIEVPDQPLWKTIRWYGLRLQFKNQQVFVARQAPKGTYKSSTACFLSVAREVEIPKVYPVQNISIDDLIPKLTRFCGIEKNFEERPSGLGTSATLRHALWFCMLNEDEIAHRRMLFHKQDQPFIPQAMRDVLPYFLAMYDEQDLRNRENLRELRKDYLDLSGQLQKAEEIERNTNFSLKTLYEQCLAAGLPLPPAMPAESNEIVERLRNCLLIPVDSGFEQFPEYSVEIDETQKMLRSLRTTFDEYSESLLHVERSIDARKGYLNEKKEQHARLRSLDLISKAKDATCPICDQHVTHDMLNVALLSEQFKSVAHQLEHVQADLAPQEARATELRNARQQLRFEWSETQRKLDSLFREKQILEQQNSLRQSQQFLRGRIDEYLNQYVPPKAKSYIAEKRNLVRENIDRLEQKIFGEGFSERAYNQTSQVNRFIRQYAKQLNLSTANTNLRFDISELTVISDSEERSVPLVGIGGARNYLAFHIIVYLSLQRHFQQVNSGVPKFLMFDQPSRPFYPKQGNLNDQDKPFLGQVLRMIVEFSQQHHIQTVVLEKAYFSEYWFENSVAEIWNDHKLIPDNWLQLEKAEK